MYFKYVYGLKLSSHTNTERKQKQQNATCNDLNIYTFIAPTTFLALAIKTR